jgi:hypothetical protein
MATLSLSYQKIQIKYTLYTIKNVKCFEQMNSPSEVCTHEKSNYILYIHVRGLLEKYPTFGREKETGLLGALDT